MTRHEREYVVENCPSSTENENFLELAAGGPHNMVMVKCLFGGAERVGVGRMVKNGKESVLRVLAILTNENDDIQVATKTGEFFTPMKVEQLSN